MKRRSLVFLLFLLFLTFSSALAQSEATTIETLNVDLWPDYDKAAVLVLLTGTLPEDASLPATLTIPLPEEVEFNVAARIDASDGLMKDDIEFSTGPGDVTFTTPDRRFRVEYYFPYSANDNERSFNFSWLASMAVSQLQVNVQEPLAAGSLRTVPASVDVITSDDGFTYHILPAQVVPGGQPFAVRVDYQMTTPTLSVESAGPSIADARTTGFTSEPAAAGGSETSWPVLAAIGVGLVLVVAAVTWQLATRRARAKPRKPSPVRAREERASSQAKYCHICGQPLQSSDKFCRECGTPAKGR